MKRHWKKLTAFLAAGVMLLPIVAACSKQESKSDPQAYRAQFQSTAENRLLDAADGVQAVNCLLYTSGNVEPGQHHSAGSRSCNGYRNGHQYSNAYAYQGGAG